MLFFILLGIWVEQKIGATKTALLFIGGSFIGLLVQVLLVKYTPILGASAGVSAIMGAFFVFFYKKEFTFLLTTLFYFKRITLPVLWIFPFMYFAADVIALGEGSNDGVGHVAHLGGLVFGMAFGYWQVKEQGLSSDELFPQEIKLSKKLSTTLNGTERFHSFTEIMMWNCQNTKSLEVFLKRSQELGFQISKINHISFLEKNFVKLTHRIFKKDEVGLTLKWVKLVPSYLSLDKFLVEIPLSHSLTLADYCARKQDWTTSLRLYEVALKKKPGQRTKLKINAAISTINELLTQETV